MVDLHYRVIRYTDFYATVLILTLNTNMLQTKHYQ